MAGRPAASRLWLSGLCFLLQLLTVVLFATFVRYSPESSPQLCSQQLNCSRRKADAGFRHPRFRDVHLRALLGFGLVVVFLSRYGPGRAAISILITAFAIQWAVLVQGFVYSFLNGKIYVGAQSIISADFCTAAVLIATGAVQGRMNPIQLLLLALLGVPLFTLNEYILLSIMGVSDSGGSLTVHTFGAYFGLAVSRILHQPRVDEEKTQQDTGHQSDAFAVVGTIYLWVFWPSFTSATTATDNAEPWAMLNTYFSLAASTMATVVLSSVLYEEATLRMVQLQDAALASAAVMGMAAEMLVAPFGALGAGFLAGLISSLGFRFLTPVLRSRLKTPDTSGVHNVHGLPGMLGAFLGTLLTVLATADAYGGRLELVFPLVARGDRTATDQALVQLCALPLTLLLAIIGACLVGPADAVCRLIESQLIIFPNFVKSVNPSDTCKAPRQTRRVRAVNNGHHMGEERMGRGAGARASPHRTKSSARVGPLKRPAMPYHGPPIHRQPRNESLGIIGGGTAIKIAGTAAAWVASLFGARFGLRQEQAAPQSGRTIGSFFTGFKAEENKIKREQRPPALAAAMPHEGNTAPKVGAKVGAK
ncbi:PREDICTED: ammonium transporter Rh type B-like, partial [Mesitornis unicolor]|uniref:ammonium transporter Rh type B-like n=1 Tax=Mesitornis unicolor TaxID=54374 RepID=UPI0005289490